MNVWGGCDRRCIFYIKIIFHFLEWYEKILRRFCEDSTKILRRFCDNIATPLFFNHWSRTLSANSPLTCQKLIIDTTMSKSYMKRHRKVLRNNIEGITKPAIRRLARRGGVKRVSGDVYIHTRKELKEFLEEVVDFSIMYTQHARRKTVTVMDLLYALRKMGKKLYL